MSSNKTFNLFIYPKVIPEFIASVITGKPEKVFIEPPSEYSSTYFAFSLFSFLFRWASNNKCWLNIIKVKLIRQYYYFNSKMTKV